MRDDIKANSLIKPVESQVIEKLESIYDPEIGLDIYNLGLIYELNLNEQKHCSVTLSFTGPACTCIETVPVEIKESLSQIDGINSVEVNIVWSPAWNLSRISRIGRMTLGINPN